MCRAVGPQDQDGKKNTVLEYYIKTETMTILFVIFLHSPVFLILKYT